MSATTTSMDLTRLELEAKATARKQVANLLQRPDQLEKVDQIRRRVSRKKVREIFISEFLVSILLNIMLYTKHQRKHRVDAVMVLATTQPHSGATLFVSIGFSESYFASIITVLTQH